MAPSQIFIAVTFIGTCLPVCATKFTGSNTLSGNRFGASVAPDCVGAPNHAQGGNTGRGAVFFYNNVSTQSGSIEEKARFIASDGLAGDNFGAAVSRSGSDLLVGAPKDDSTSPTISDRGSAYLFREVFVATGAVTQTAKLEAASAAAGDEFGTSVALDGSLGLVGNPYLNFFSENDRGAVYLFKNLNTATGTINESTILYDTDGQPNDKLGISVSMRNDTAVAGAPGDDVGSNTDQGSVALFRNLAAAGSFGTQSVKLTASDGAAGDGLGSAVAIGSPPSSTTRHVVAGAPMDDSPSKSNSGSAYLYRVLSTATGTLTQSAKFVPVQAADEDQFGYSVSISSDGDMAVVGAPGRFDDPYADGTKGYVCIFLNLGTITGTVNETLRITPDESAIKDGFGCAVLLENGRFTVGAAKASGKTTSSGAAWNGSVSHLTRTDSGGKIEKLNFTSRTNWIIGDTASNTTVTLASDARAALSVAGTAIRVGSASTANSNRLVLDGPVAASSSTVIVGNSVNTGNELRVNNFLTSSGVTIHRDSILSGAGTIDAPVSITGSLRPGNSELKTLRVLHDVTWNEGNAWQFGTAAGNLSDRLQIQGSGSDFLKGTGSAKRTFDFLGSSQAGTYTLVTWDGTTTFSASDFQATNVGGGLSATFAIVAKSLTVTLGSGLTLLEQWRQTHFGSPSNSGNAANVFDFDLDGIPNLVEYALGTVPTNSGSSARPMLGQSNNRLTLSFTPQVLTGLTYSVQTSNNLSSWTTTNLSGLSVGVPYTWTDTVTISPGSKRFARLRVAE